MLNFRKVILKSLPSYGLREAIILAKRLIFPFAKWSTIISLLILTYAAYFWFAQDIFVFKKKLNVSSH